MGDWIWVLITALITFLAISFVNVNSVNEPTQLFLDFPAESTQGTEESELTRLVKESIWQKEAPKALIEEEWLAKLESVQSYAESESAFIATTQSISMAVQNSRFPIGILFAFLIFIATLKAILTFRRSSLAHKMTRHST